MTPRARSTIRRRTFAQRTGCRPTRFPIMRGPAPNAGTICSTGARTNMPASDPAPTAVSISTATGMPPRPKSARRRGWRASRATGMARVTDDVLMREEIADEFLLMGLRLAEGIDPARYATLAGRPLDEARIATLRAERFCRNDVRRPAARQLAGFSGARRRGRRFGRVRLGRASNAKFPRRRSCAVPAR